MMEFSKRRLPNTRWIVFLFSLLFGLFKVGENGGNDQERTAERVGDTSTWNWPVVIDYFSIDEKIFFLVEDVVTTLSLKNEVKRRGFTRIDGFLKEEGGHSCFIVVVYVTTLEQLVYSR